MHRKSSSKDMEVNQSNDNTPKPRRQKSNIEINTSQLIQAFEKTKLNDLQSFDDSELVTLFVKETIRVKPKQKKAKFPDFGLFKKSEKNEETKSQEKQGLAAENFLQLDLAKKERRLQQLLNKRSSLKQELEQSILASIPIPQTMADYDLSEYGSPLIMTKDPHMLVELGDKNTTFDAQAKMLFIQNPEPQIQSYYQEFFYSDDHTNLIGHSEELGPIIISIESSAKAKNKAHLRVYLRSKTQDKWLFIPSELKSTKEQIAAIKEQVPELTNVKLEKSKHSDLPTKLLELERRLNEKPTCKVGVIYCVKGQTSEDEMYSNEKGSPAFEEFLEWLGQKVTLKGWTKYSGGLDTTENRTGTHSIFTEYSGFEIMFHVSTLLPLVPGDEQQLERKRHIGNDIVTIVFVDKGHQFDPTWLVSELLHVFIVISQEVTLSPTDTSHYKMAVASKPGVIPFGPKLPHPAIFPKCAAFREFLLTKIINGEAAALQAPAFRERIKRTKEIFLKNLVKEKDKEPKEKSEKLASGGKHLGS